MEDCEYFCHLGIVLQTSMHASGPGRRLGDGVPPPARRRPSRAHDETRQMRHHSVEATTLSGSGRIGLFFNCKLTNQMHRHLGLAAFDPSQLMKPDQKFWLTSAFVINLSMRRWIWEYWHNLIKIRYNHKTYSNLIRNRTKYNWPSII